MISLLFLLVLQSQIPSPTGFINDFAGVIDGASERAMQGVIDEVRSKSGGEIVVVTMRDLGGQAPIEVARDIGRTWRVGATGEAGDRARNAGAVLLLMPGNRIGDGTSQLAIGTGIGAEGFITDARAGRIRDAIGQVAIENGSYGAGLTAGVWLLAEAYAEEFQFELTGTAPIEIPSTSSRHTNPFSR
ncbi:MAG: TPM domain-containing protein, partial [Gemmatimonadales bacterium]